MNYRIITRRAHKMVIPFRTDEAFVSVHAELMSVFMRQKSIEAELKKDLAALVDQDLREERI